MPTDTAYILAQFVYNVTSWNGMGQYLSKANPVRFDECHNLSSIFVSPVFPYCCESRGDERNKAKGMLVKPGV